MLVDKNLKVGSKSFYDFYTGSVAGKSPLFPIGLNKVNFELVLENWDHLTGSKESSWNKFIAIFCIILNETGGQFKGITEMGGDAYFFENRTLHNGMRKRSYNQKPNLKAGDQLREWGVIHSDKAQLDWNNTDKYPSEYFADIKLAARNCDFYKFRGRGFMQLTWRDNYSICFGKDFLHWTNEQLDKSFEDIKVCCAVFQNFNLQPYAASSLAKVEKGDFYSYGRCVSGGDAYGKLFQNRCSYLIKLINGK